MVDPRATLRHSLGLAVEPTFTASEAAGIRIAAIDALLQSVRATPPGEPLVTPAWALARLRALYPDLSEAKLRDIIRAGREGRAGCPEDEVRAQGKSEGLAVTRGRALQLSGWVLLLGLGLSIGILVAGAKEIDWLRPVEVAILAATGAVVWWYTAETQRLREVSEAQLLASQEPRVVFDQRVTPEGAVIIRNVGPGMALSVTARLLPAPMPEGESDPADEAAPWTCGTLLAGAEAEPWRVPLSLQGIALQGGGSRDHALLQVLCDNAIPIEVSYRDAQGRSMVSLALLGVGMRFVGADSRSAEARADLERDVSRVRRAFAKANGLGVGFPQAERPT